jgi:hypothetical protein
VWRKRDPVTGEKIVDQGDEMQYCEARPGDTLIAPFECDNCSFFRIEYRWPTLETIEERTLGAYIRQVNLDMFWSRAKGTVLQNLREFRSQAQIGQDFGFAAFEPRGPFPRTYDGEMRAAIAVLMKAQKDGRDDEKIKFSTARRSRSIQTNMFKSSAIGHTQTLFIRVDQKRSIASSNPTDSEFFTLFLKGFENRVGQRVKRDRAVSVEIVVELQRMPQEMWDDAVRRNDKQKQREVEEWTCYFLYTFCHSLRGWEKVKAVVSRLRSQIVNQAAATTLGISPHLGLPMYGRFKSCRNSNSQLLCMIAAETASGLKPLVWTERLLITLDEAELKSD